MRRNPTRLTNLSGFGRAFPPFDYVGVEDIDSEKP